MRHDKQSPFQLLKGAMPADLRETLLSAPEEQRIHLIRGSALTALFLFCYAEAILTLSSIWWKNPMYTHGFLIPLVSIYFVWTQRTSLTTISPFPNYPFGMPLLAAGLMLLLLGQSGSIVLLQGYSIIITIAGIVLFLLGFRYLAALWLPIAYLVFMIPFARLIVDDFHRPFQIGTARLATAFLHAIGIPCFRESQFITLPHITLEVAKGCSGVNYLVSLLAVGIPFAYMTQRRWPRRIVLIIGAIIIAILANGLRVGLIGLLSYIGIDAPLHGPHHVLQALFVYVIGLAFLFSAGWLLSRYDEATAGTVSSKDKREPARALRNPAKPDALKKPFFITLAMLLLVGLYVHFYKPRPVPVPQALASFPYEIEAWTGFDSVPQHDPFGALGVDHVVSRTYHSPQGDVQLYIGYYAYQEQGKEMVHLKSEWLHQGAATTTIPVRGAGTIKVNQLIRTEGGRTRIILHWYVLDGHSVTETTRAKILTALNGILKRRSNGAFIMVSVDTGPLVNAEQALTSAMRFASEMVPFL